MECVTRQDIDHIDQVFCTLAEEEGEEGRGGRTTQFVAAAQPSSQWDSCPGVQLPGAAVPGHAA